MKRIFCNTKLKKIIISILLVIIFVNYTMPSVVLAAVTEITHTDYKFSYQDWLSLKDDESCKEIIAKYGTDKYEEDLKEATITALRKTFYAKEDAEDTEKAKKLSQELIANNPTGIKINGTLEIGTNWLGFTVCNFEIKTYKTEYGKVPEIALDKEAHEDTTEVPMKYKELLEWSSKTPEEVYEEVIAVIMEDTHLVGKNNDSGIGGGYTARDAAEKLLELNEETIVLMVVGENTAYTIMNFEIPDKDKETAFREVADELDIPYDYEEAKEDSADAGGLLLNLVVPLVNFIADSLIASLGSIMNGNGLEFGLDILVSEGERWKVPADVTEFTEVSTNSFTLGGIQYPNITYTPEEIFSGEIELLSIDFISGKNYEGMKNTNTDWNGIRSTISQWYKVLRLIAIIGLLSVLIYTGIKIIISANAKDKAKYKEWIMNWFFAVAILFFMHYIMAFIIAITGEISKLITEVGSNIYVKPINGEGEPFATNLMGLVRFMIQSDNFYMKVGYEAMYIALIFYTIKFTFVYLKRVLNMAFLTLIAPIVALTYPIDKINDGKAQGFDMWLKEYTFNALLQPMHCILYYILVGSAVQIAASNPLYGIVVLGFMTEAEKLLKSIFGFSKAGAGTVGGLGSAFAAGAIASSLSKLAKFPKGGSGGSGGSGGDDPALESPKPTNKPGMDAFNDDGGTPGDDSSSGEDNGGSDGDKTLAQKMFDADEENGAFDGDAAYRDSLASEAYGSQSDGNEDANMSDEEYEEMLRDQYGMDDETIALAMEQRRGGSPSDSGDSGSGDSGSGGSGSDGSDSDSDSSSGDSGRPIRDMAARKWNQFKNSKYGRGAGAVGKKLLKPVWDLDKSRSYNFKRLGKGALKTTAKALGGFALGATAAAVQAGISITDGKYNPMEGLAAVTAGFAGSSRLVDGASRGLGSMIDTYREGAMPTASDARKAEIMARAQERYGDRDDVIAFNKKNYPGQEKQAMERQRDNYLTAGVTDLKEMKSGMKYADSLVGKTDGLTDAQIKSRREAADRKAAATIDFRKNLKEQGMLGAVYDKDKRDKYIQSMVDKASAADKAKVRKQYENAFKSVAAYDAANA